MGALTRVLSEKAMSANKAAKTAADELQATKHAAVEGTKHWKKLRACATVNRHVAMRMKLREEIKRTAAATRSYQDKASHFKRLLKKQAQLAREAERKVHAASKRSHELQRQQQAAERKEQ